MESSPAGKTARESGSIQQGEIALSYLFLRPHPVKATVMIVHGINDHKGRYLDLQENLAAGGFASLAYDQRGFGASGGRRTDVDHYEAYLSDLKAMLHLIREASPEKPTFLLGHSLGGLISATFCIDFPRRDFPEGISGLILSSPAYEVRPLPFGLEHLVTFLSRVVPGVSIPYSACSHQRSHDPAVASAVAVDPLIVTSATPRFYVQFRKMNRYFQAHADRIDFPTLILQAGADTIVTPHGARVLYNRLKNPKKKLLWYDGFYHEVFHESDRFRVMSDLTGWLDSQLL